jgi:hypothetical protein
MILFPVNSMREALGIPVGNVKFPPAWKLDSTPPDDAFFQEYPELFKPARLVGDRPL